MAFIVDGKRVVDVGHGVIFYFENPCTKDGGHEYADILCPQCGRDYCFSCGILDQDKEIHCPDCGE